LEDIRKSSAKIKDELKYLDFSHNLLKDGGIKAKVIKKYLPLMNDSDKQIFEYDGFLYKL